MTFGVISLGCLLCLLAEGQTRPRSGVETLEREVARFNEMIRQNEADYLRVVSGHMADLSARMAGGDLKTAWETYKAADKLIFGDYLTRTSEFAKLLSKTIKTVAPQSPVGLGLRGGEPIVKYSLKLLEIGLLTAEHGNLVEQRDRLQLQLFRETTRDPQRIAAGEALLRGWKESQEKWRDELQARHEALRAAEIKSVFEGKSSSDARHLGVGAIVVDPYSEVWDLEKVPGINPAFVVSLRAQAQLIRDGRLDAAALADLQRIDVFNRGPRSTAQQVVVPRTTTSTSPDTREAISTDPTELEAALDAAEDAVDRRYAALKQARDRASDRQDRCWRSCPDAAKGADIAVASACVDRCNAEYESAVAPLEKQFDAAVDRRNELRIKYRRY